MSLKAIALSIAALSALAAQPVFAQSEVAPAVVAPTTGLAAALPATVAGVSTSLVTFAGFTVLVAADGSKKNTAGTTGTTGTN